MANRNNNRNARYAREVENYRRRRKRLVDAGFKNVLPDFKLRDLRSIYNSSSDLEKQLKVLAKFTQKTLLNKITTKSGAKVSSWQFANLKTNRELAKNYFEKEYERINQRVFTYPGERTYLNNIQAKIGLLDLDINVMDEQQFRSAHAAILEFEKSNEMRRAEYRGFLNEVDWLMEKLDVPSEKRDKFFKKFETLTPQQFLYVYDNNPIIAKIYSLYHKSSDGEAYIMEEEDPEEMLNQLMKYADAIVKEAKLNAD